MCLVQTPKTVMRVRLCISFLILLSLFTASGSAGVRHTPALDAGYASALAAADHLLQDWQSGDPENGMSLLTSHAKETAGTEAVEKFFSNSSTVAYEIGHGKLLKHGRYEFPVVLVSHASKNNRLRRQFSSIIVLNTGSDDWAVDKLP
jgi:hypothetical protein